MDGNYCFVPFFKTPTLPKKVDKFKNYMRSSFKITDEKVSTAILLINHFFNSDERRRSPLNSFFACKYLAFGNTLLHRSMFLNGFVSFSGCYKSLGLAEGEQIATMPFANSFTIKVNKMLLFFEDLCVLFAAKTIPFGHLGNIVMFKISTKRLKPVRAQIGAKLLALLPLFFLTTLRSFKFRSGAYTILIPPFLIPCL